MLAVIQLYIERTMKYEMILILSQAQSVKLNMLYFVFSNQVCVINDLG